jgi:RNA polymerase sigma factor (sigma-70 family)
MSQAQGNTNRILDRLKQGDSQAPQDLIAHYFDRFKQWAEELVRRFPILAKRTGYESAAVNEAAMRMQRYLRKHPWVSRDEFRRFARKEVFRALVRLKKKLLRRYGQSGAISLQAGVDEGQFREPQPRRRDISDTSDTLDLMEAINRLPTDLREVIEANLFEDLSQKELAEKLNITERTVRNRELAAQRMLGKFLKGPESIHE